MIRREVITLLGGAAAWPLAARAQQPAALPVIGFLHLTSRDETRGYLVDFHQGLAQAGYIEGNNVAIEYRWGEGHNDRMPSLIADLVRRQVSVIVTLESTLTALAAKKATSTIPVVMLSGFAPVESGLVASLGHPGGNVTGIGVTPATLGTYVELLKEARPGLQRVAILRDASFASQPTWEEAAKKFGVAATVVDVPRAGDLDTAFETITKEGAEAIIVMPAGPLVVRIQDIAGFGFQNKLPTMVTSRALAEIGGFMSYGSPRDALYKRAAWYVDKVLRDGKPADLPVEEISPLELVVNVKVAKILGMTVPPTLLQRANHVIE